MVSLEFLPDLLVPVRFKCELSPVGCAIWEGAGTLGSGMLLEEVDDWQ